MNEFTQQQLLALNRTFYERFAAEFADTRGSNQPGLQRLLAYLPPIGPLLDVGCGNGRLAYLLERSGWQGEYVGVDSSPSLLHIAAAAAIDLQAVKTRFLQVDVTATGWAASLPAGPYAAISLLALLHHLPGRALRQRVLREAHELLAPGGILVLSTWQFLNSPRLRRKVVDWPVAGIDPDQVEPGDYLLDWRRGGLGYRYCHLIDEAEVRELAEAAGLSVTNLFYADGREGNLNLFAVLVG